MKVISLASSTCDHETEMLILTMHLKVFGNVKYYKKVIKYNYKYFKTSI